MSSVIKHIFLLVGVAVASLLLWYVVIGGSVDVFGRRIESRGVSYIAYKGFEKSAVSKWNINSYRNGKLNTEKYNDIWEDIEKQKDSDKNYYGKKGEYN